MGFVDWVLFGWLLTLGLLGLTTCGVVIYSRHLAMPGRNSDTADGKPSSSNGPRELIFYAAEGCPKTLLQRGYRHFFFGRLLTALWVFVMVISFVMMATLAVCTYFPEVAEALDTDWNGITGAFIITFFIFHTMAILLIELYSTIVVSLMLPSSPANASHLMIEEALPAALIDDKLVGPGDTDEDPTPGLAKRFLAKFRQIVEAYRRTRCRTLLRIDDDPITTVRTVEYTCVRYRYDSTIEAFAPAAEGMKVTPAQARQRLLNGGLSMEECSNLQRLIGRNEIGVQLPSVFMSLVDEFSTVFYVIQSMGCWVDLGYSLWNIGGICFTVMLVTGAVKALVVIRPQKKKLHELAQHKTNVNVLRDGRWQSIESTQVVIGDVLRLQEQHELVCDGYVIDGTAVLNEAALTGEPMPVQKVAVEKSSTLWDARNIVHAGTLCVKSSGSSDDEAVMIVSAIGGLTAKGKMVRIVMFPEPVRFKYHDQLPLVYLGLFLYALLLSVAYFVFTRIGNWVVTILQVMVAVKQSINPMLPVAMVMGQTVAAKRLRNHHKIFCLQPERIPVAGKISVMVFDKTGTITKDGMELVGVLPAQGGKLGNRLDMASPSTPSTLAGTLLSKCGDTDGLTEELHRGLACCHSVIRLRDGSLSGDQVEIAMFNASGWTISDKGEVVITSPDGCTELSVLRHMHFQRETMTSGCIVQTGITSDCHNSRSLTVFVKGSPESIMKCCTTVPDVYMKACEELAAENLYVLAMASKNLSVKVTAGDLTDMKRSDLETGLSLVGLLLFKNEVKSDSALAIKMLKDGDIRSVVCTGDNALTAIGISKEVGIIDYNKPILLANINNNNQLTWIDVNNNNEIKKTIDDPVNGVHDDQQLVVTRSVWRYLINNKEQLDKYWYNIKVYARMKPSDKVSVIKSLQSRKLVVGMCGDGGNDCGALRAAHAAMALSEAEASMVSPFSSSRDSSSLITVVDLIREGRACLATNLATYSFFIVYAFTLTIGRLAITIIGNFNVSEWVYIMNDIVLGVGMSWTMTLSGPSKQLAPYRPTASLIGWRTILSCMIPILISYICQAAALIMLRLPAYSDWYYYVNTLDLAVLPRDWMKKGDNYDTAALTLVLMLLLATHAFSVTFGGAFRRSIFRNWSVVLFYVLFLIFGYFLVWTPPTTFSCIYRMNCDTGASLDTAGIPVISQYSVGSIGGCFLGPQIHRYQQLGYPNWTPSPVDHCRPPAAALAQLPWDSPEISTLGYDGPNNVFSTSYAVAFTILTASCIASMLLWVKVGLLGWVSSWIRRNIHKTLHSQLEDASP